MALAAGVPWPVWSLRANQERHAYGVYGIPAAEPAPSSFSALARELIKPPAFNRRLPRHPPAAAAAVLPLPPLLLSCSPLLQDIHVMPVYSSLDVADQPGFGAEFPGVYPYTR